MERTRFFVTDLNECNWNHGLLARLVHGLVQGLMLGLVQGVQELVQGLVLGLVQGLVQGLGYLPRMMKMEGRKM
jgi:ABC-type dipeptide/oligopeptide/nickel transport system permease subunit